MLQLSPFAFKVGARLMRPSPGGRPGDRNPRRNLKHPRRVRRFEGDPGAVHSATARTRPDGARRGGNRAKLRFPNSLARRR
jgi:hypothetical protein